MATELEEMSRAAARLADERDSLMAQLRTHRAPSKQRAPCKSEPGSVETAGAPADKENEAPEWTPAAVAEAALQLLQQETDRGGAKNVRFSSPLLTPKSNAHAQRPRTSAGPQDPGRGRQLASVLDTIGVDPTELRRPMRDMSERKCDDLALEVCGPVEDAHAAGLPSRTRRSGCCDAPAHLFPGGVQLTLKLVVWQNSTLKALISTKDVELTGLRHQLRVADERAAVSTCCAGLPDVVQACQWPASFHFVSLH